MSKDSRQGGKYAGSHTTLIPLAARTCDVAEVCADVTKISLGFIKAGIGTTSKPRVKIEKGETVLLLSVRDTASHQEVRVWASNLQRAMEAISRGLRNEGIAIAFK